MVDVNKLLKGLMKKGITSIGERQTKISLENGNSKLVITANNCPYLKEIETMCKEKDIPLFKYAANGVELGAACGKKFMISSISVIDEGDSSILQLAKKGK
jgi:large subunit ribosomal protein L30e